MLFVSSQLPGIVPVEIAGKYLLVSGRGGLEGDLTGKNAPIPGEVINHLTAKPTDDLPLLVGPARVALPDQKLLLEGIVQAQLDIKKIVCNQHTAGDKKLGTHHRPVFKLNVGGDKAGCIGLFQKRPPIDQLKVAGKVEGLGQQGGCALGKRPLFRRGCHAFENRHRHRNFP